MSKEFEFNLNQTILDTAKKDAKNNGTTRIKQISFSGSENNEQIEISIAWRNLRLVSKGTFSAIDGKKVILNRLNGCFEYHSLNAFMGPSGAGKTTLLNCLNGNQISGLTNESEIYLNKDQQDGKMVSYFIEQHVERTIVGRMRVGQILRYAYRFKNGNEGDIEGHFRKTIDELLLDELVLHRNFEQCSGGEQKRVAIAQELMSLQKPTLLFVDEPTTGLDSNAAHLVMKCLRQLATNHRMAIITSIHVPSDDILTLFDKLYVLAKGGVCIYSGRPDQLRPHLETQIKKLVIPDEQPPIEFLTKIACNEITDNRVETLALQTLSKEYRSVTRHLSQLEPYPNGVPNHRKPFSINHFLLLTCRMFRIAFLSDSLVLFFMLFGGFYYITFMVTLFSSDMVKPSSCYSLLALTGDISNDNQTGDSLAAGKICTNQIENDSQLKQNILFHGSNVGYISFSIICVYSILVGPYVRVFCNEYRNRWYSLGVFYWSYTLVTMIQVIVFSILYSLYGYFISGQHFVDNYELNSIRIGYYILFHLILSIYIQSIGQLIGVLIWKNAVISVIGGQLVGIVATMYSGHLIDLEYSNSLLIYITRKILPVSNIFKAMIYIFYGFERCNPETEYSLAMVNNHVGEGQLYNYGLEVLINLALIRLFILAYMYWRFNTFKKRISTIAKEKLPIEYNSTQSNKVELNIELSVEAVQRKSKQEDEIEFEKFSRYKVCVAWRNLSLFGTTFIFEQAAVETEAKGLGEKAILKNLNGELRFGTLNALMGTSGAGKTSLLKVLNGRDKTRLSAQSQFYLSKFTRIQTCFITQDVSGHLLPGLTAKQMLVYASRLKNSEMSEKGVDTALIDHQQIALNLLDQLEMSNIVDTPVEKCSSGERKRLALALELTAIQMPNLICIDEPTSGLDSNSAEVVMSCLRKMTQNHCITIVTSIHQPNTEVLLMFDQIYVLARGGVCIYSGDPTSILDHLLAVPDTCSQDCKFPIETLIKHSSNAYPDPIVCQLTTVSDKVFTETVVDSGLLELQTQLVPDGIQHNRRRFSLVSTWILGARYLAYIRGYLWIQWIVYLLLFLAYGCFLGILYDPIIATPSGCLSMDEDFNSSCSKTEEKIVEENLISYNIQYLSFAFGWFFALAMIQSAMTFDAESVYFYNEHRNGWYSTGSFYLTKSFFSIVPYLLLLMPYCYICNIYESLLPGVYYQLLGLMFLTMVAYQGMFNIVGMFGRIHVLALISVGVCLFLLNIMITNPFSPIANAHYIYRTLSLLSIVGYLLDALTLVQYGFGRCQPKQFQPILYLFSLSDSDYYRCIFGILVLMVVFHAAALALLIYLSNPEPDRRNQIQRIKNFVQKLRPTNAIIPGIDSPNQFRIKVVKF